MFQKRTLIIVFVTVALGLAFGTFFIRSNHKQDTKKVKASSATNTITSQADWDIGTKSDVIADSGSIKIDITATSLNLAKIYEQDHSRLTSDNPNPENAIDGNTSTFYGIIAPESTTTWTLDLGRTYKINQFEYYIRISLGAISFSTSTDGVTFSDRGGNSSSSPSWFTTSFAPVDARYIQFNSHAYGCAGDCWDQIFEIKAFGSLMGVHTTAPTQIDGGTNFWQWESFTDTKTVPANTSVAYRYRTSSDSTTWTSWVGAIGSVTSRIGDTKYRYLQVEATLTNTDGTSTPTIDQYDIGYHTETKPNKPTAQTAVTQ